MGAIVPVKDIMAQLTTPGMMQQIKNALPKHLTPERMIRVVQTALQTTPALASCDKMSLIGCIVQCSQLGLEPNGMLGHAYLIPYKSKSGNTVCQIIAGYKGLMDLARRSGQLKSIQAHVVYDKDRFEYCYGLDPKLNHVPASGERGAPTHAYAVAHLKDGGVQFEVMAKNEIEKIRNSSSGYQYAKKMGYSCVWTEHPDEMWRKTCIRRLAKYLPMSIEFQRLASLDEAAEAGVPQVLDVDFQTVDQPTEQAARVEQVRERVAAKKAEQVPSADDAPPTEEPTEQTQEPPTDDAGVLYSINEVAAMTNKARACFRGWTRQIDKIETKKTAKGAEYSRLRLWDGDDSVWVHLYGTRPEWLNGAAAVCVTVLDGDLYRPDETKSGVWNVHRIEQHIPE